MSDFMVNNIIIDFLAENPKVSMAVFYVFFKALIKFIVSKLQNISQNSHCEAC